MNRSFAVLALAALCGACGGGDGPSGPVGPVAGTFTIARSGAAANLGIVMFTVTGTGAIDTVRSTAGRFYVKRLSASSFQVIAAVTGPTGTVGTIVVPDKSKSYTVTVNQAASTAYAIIPNGQVTMTATVN